MSDTKDYLLSNFPTDGIVRRDSMSDAPDAGAPVTPDDSFDDTRANAIVGNQVISVIRGSNGNDVIQVADDDTVMTLQIRPDGVAIGRLNEEKGGQREEVAHSEKLAGLMDEEILKFFRSGAVMDSDESIRLIGRVTAIADKVLGPSPF